MTLERRLSNEVRRWWVCFVKIVGPKQRRSWRLIRLKKIVAEESAHPAMNKNSTWHISTFPMNHTVLGAALLSQTFPIWKVSRVTQWSPALRKIWEMLSWRGTYRDYSCSCHKISALNCEGCFFWKGSKNLKQATFWGINQTVTRDSFTLHTQYSHTWCKWYDMYMSLLVTCRIYHKTLYFSTHLSVYGCFQK